MLRDKAWNLEDMPRVLMSYNRNGMHLPITKLGARENHIPLCCSVFGSPDRVSLFQDRGIFDVH